MLHPKILVLSNDLTRITTNSLKANMPTSDYKTVKCGGNPVETALNNTDDITIVVRGGVVFTPKKNDLPPKKHYKNIVSVSVASMCTLIMTACDHNIQIYKCQLMINQ